MNVNNPMRELKIEKITINFGAGSDHDKLLRGEKLFERIFKKPGVKTKSRKRIQGWGLRIGLPIGIKLTMRGDEANTWLKQFLDARDFNLKETCVDNDGNLSFGVPEYIEIPGTKYDPEIGMLGFEVSVTFKRKGGFRIKHRRLLNQKVPRKHRIPAEEIKEYMIKHYKVNFVGDNDDSNESY
jgi:large subunit ribosomal protein L5